MSKDTVGVITVGQLDGWLFRMPETSTQEQIEKAQNDLIMKGGTIYNPPLTTLAEETYQEDKNV